MIPFKLALLAWIPISALFMLDKNNARGFALAYILGIMFLPAGLDLELPGVPDLGKDNVATIGVLLGTILFHPKLFDRFKLYPSDILLFVSLELIFITSYANHFGVYDGVSQAVAFILNFILPIYLARIHICTPNSIRIFLLFLIGASVIYVPLALYEFRMSPQIHTLTYGYFQHVFQQHFRGGFWRPIVYFSHALQLARFFAFCAFLAFLPMRKDLVKIFGRYGNLVFLAPLFGLFLSQSYGPYLLFFLLCLFYFLMRWHPSMLYILPVGAFVWLFFVMLGYKPGYDIVASIAYVNPDRAASFEYRLIALQEYREIILNRLWFGHGGWGHGRIEGRATDSQVLISLISRGFVGSTFYFAWWFSAAHAATRSGFLSMGTVFSRRARAVGALACLSMAVITVDAALDLHLLLLLGGLLPIQHWVAAHPDLPTLPPHLVHPAQRSKPLSSDARMIS